MSGFAPPDHRCFHAYPSIRCNRTIIKAEEYLHSTLLWWSADFVEERNNARMKIENLNEAIDVSVSYVQRGGRF